MCYVRGLLILVEVNDSKRLHLYLHFNSIPNK